MKYIIWLQLVISPASPLCARILEKKFSAEYIYNNIDKITFFSDEIKKKAAKISLKKAEDILKYCAENEISIITYESKNYPQLLLNIPDPPLVLYYKGDLPDFDLEPSICVVGPRKVTEYGYKCAYSLAARLSIAGFIIVSGGAVGCDYAAHDGALCHEGFTVAVLGNGFGDDYLKKNEELRRRIAEKGCLITEYPPRIKATKFTFPQRNRIMAALCDGTVLVEAPKKSGALITAGLTIDYNRDLFVIPGNPGNPDYEGSNLLLRDGAKPLLEISDVFSEYLWKYPDKIDIEKSFKTKLRKPALKTKPGELNTASKLKSQNVANKRTEKELEKIINIEIIKKILPEHLSKNAKIVYNYLDKLEFVCDDIYIDGLTLADITAAFGELEIYGFIKALPGGRYSLIIKE